jgi:lipoprotein-anchoring transpeptidase ErfK/SrfK
MLGRACAVMVAAIIAAGLTASSAYASGLSRTQVNHAQKRLGALGFEVGSADGVVGPMTARGMCAFELIYSLHPRLGMMNHYQYRRLMRTRTLRSAAHPESSYLSVSTRCQVLYEARNHRYRRIIPASTGHAGKDSLGRQSFATRPGRWLISSKVNGWQESNAYSGGWMWRPMYFSGGEAIHGESSASSVLPYFASHGCVRVFSKDQNVLWQKYPTRTVVYVG